MKQPVIIIGMHRSGTSMLTRILQDAGLFMGINKDENDEAWYFLSFNDWIIRQANASWDNPYNYNFIDQKFKTQIKRIFNQRKKSLHLINYIGFKNYLKYRSLDNIDFAWGWKDPRSTLTLDIWKDLYPNAKVIHIYRNPIDVAYSLKVRSEKINTNYNITYKTKIKEYLLKGNAIYNISYRVMNIHEGYLLWKEYVEKALNESDALHIQYEDLLENPQSNLKKVFEYINLSVSENHIEKYTKYFDASRKYAFIRNDTLVQFYNQIKNDHIVQKLSYGNIV